MGYAAHPVLYAMSTEVKRMGREADHLPSYSAEIKSGGAMTPVPIFLHCVRLSTLTNLPYIYI
jgi:hypothetical protein